MSSSQPPECCEAIKLRFNNNYLLMCRGRHRYDKMKNILQFNISKNFLI